MGLFSRKKIYPKTDLSFSFGYGDFSGYISDLDKKHTIAIALPQNTHWLESFVDVSNKQRASLSRCIDDMSIENVKMMLANYDKIDQIAQKSVFNSALKSDFEDWHLENFSFLLRLTNQMITAVNHMEHCAKNDMKQYQEDLGMLLGKEKVLAAQFVEFAKKAEVSLLEFYNKAFQRG